MELFRKKILFGAVALFILIGASTAAMAEEGAPGDKPVSVGPCAAWPQPRIDLEADWNDDTEEILVSVSTKGWEDLGVLSFRLTYPEDLIEVEKPSKMLGLEGSSIVCNEEGLFALWMDSEGCQMSKTELLTLRFDASESMAEEWTLELSEFCFADHTGTYAAEDNPGNNVVTVKRKGKIEKQSIHILGAEIEQEEEVWRLKEVQFDLPEGESLTYEEDYTVNNLLIEEKEGIIIVRGTVTLLKTDAAKKYNLENDTLDLTIELEENAEEETEENSENKVTTEPEISNPETETPQEPAESEALNPEIDTPFEPVEPEAENPKEMEKESIETPESDSKETFNSEPISSPEAEAEVGEVLE